jgi:hypothetical protein
MTSYQYKNTEVLHIRYVMYEYATELIHSTHDDSITRTVVYQSHANYWGSLLSLVVSYIAVVLVVHSHRSQVVLNLLLVAVLKCWFSDWG